MATTNETKEQRFQRLAEQRVNGIIDKLRVLSQLSNKSNYDYTDVQVEAIFKALQKEFNDTRSKFRNGSNGRKRFTL